MWATNLKIVGVVLGTLALYTLIANKIPQVQSEVPQALTLGANVTPEQLVAAGQKVYTDSASVRRTCSRTKRARDRSAHAAASGSRRRPASNTCTSRWATRPRTAS